MASIIDTVREAEARASAVRLDAAAKAKEDVKRANELAERLAETAAEKAREAEAAALAEGEREGAELMAKLIEDGRAASERECAEADARMGAAVKYIVDRVISA